MPVREDVVVPSGITEMYVRVPENRLSMNIVESISADGKTRANYDMTGHAMILPDYNEILPVTFIAVVRFMVMNTSNLDILRCCEGAWRMKGLSAQELQCPQNSNQAMCTGLRSVAINTNCSIQ